MEVAIALSEGNAITTSRQELRSAPHIGQNCAEAVNLHLIFFYPFLLRTIFRAHKHFNESSKPGEAFASAQIICGIGNCSLCGRGAGVDPSIDILFIEHHCMFIRILFAFSLFGWFYPLFLHSDRA